MLWEITLQDRHGHRRVTRIRALTREAALAALDLGHDAGRAGPTVVDAHAATQEAPQEAAAGR